MAAKRNAAAAKLHERVAELRSRFDERGTKLIAVTSAADETEEEVKDYQSACISPRTN